MKRIDNYINEKLKIGKELLKNHSYDFEINVKEETINRFNEIDNAFDEIVKYVESMEIQPKYIVDYIKMGSKVSSTTNIIYLVFTDDLNKVNYKDLYNEFFIEFIIISKEILAIVNTPNQLQDCHKSKPSTVIKFVLASLDSILKRIDFFKYISIRYNEKDI